MSESDQPTQTEGEKHLIELLNKELNGGDESDQAIEFNVDSGESGEPRVTQISHSHVGLALSGGGVRSATFNLGVLQGLARRGILQRLNYLSTVSGGGYIGGFWTAWRHRRAAGELADQEDDPELFPLNHPRGSDHPAIRHLREFSNFLAPRPGLFTAEGSRLTLAFIGLMLPTLLLASILLAIGSSMASCAHSAAGMLTKTFLGEVSWIRWLHDYHLLPLLPGVVLLTAGLACLLLQISWQSAVSQRTTPPGSNWTVRAVFGVGLVWLFFTAIATITENIQSILGGATKLTESSGIITIAASWWFARRRHQMLVDAIQGLGNSHKTKAHAGTILNLLPAIIVVSATCALYSLVDRFVTESRDDFLRFQIAIFLMLALICLAGLAWFFFHPAIISMHEFYRARIATSFLRASRRGKRREHHNQESFNPRDTNEHSKDDIALTDLAKEQSAAAGHPLHLICCTANDLHGDRLKNLGYGAKSAVLSCHGLWSANRRRDWEKRENLHLSAALTASAAAFNSQMGLFSAGTGRGVGFLMSALNLRLGIWARSPRFPMTRADDRPPRPAQGDFGQSRNKTLRVGAPGRYFFKEMFSRTDAFHDPYVHLSDGGHFENLGLYELIRRQCRYIIVCDADTDPRAVSTNLGRAIRRIRSDFGVAIEIETAPLQSDDAGLASQHVVTGRIRYGNGQTGILYYLRANITGDEPADVLHYRSDHPEFPYQSTADQFYDESQWEAYRMLGEHIALEAFGFVDRVKKPARLSDAYWADLFNTGLWLWRQPSQRILDRLAACNLRREQLAAEMEQRAPNSLLVQFSPEAANAFEAEAPEMPAPEDLADEFKWVHRIAVFMEGVWHELDFTQHEDFPALNGWYNNFARWTRIPSFQIAWPILRTMFDYEFITFIESLRAGPSKSSIHIRYSKKAGNYNLRFQCRVTLAGKKCYYFNLGSLDNLAIKRGVAAWNCYDFKMNDALRGVGYGRQCLNQLIEDLRNSRVQARKAHRFRVLVDYPPKGYGISYSLSSVVGLYQELGFSPEMGGKQKHYHLA